MAKPKTTIKQLVAVVQLECTSNEQAERMATAIDKATDSWEGYVTAWTSATPVRDDDTVPFEDDDQPVSLGEPEDRTGKRTWGFDESE